MDAHTFEIRVRKDEENRLYRATIDDRVVGDLAYETNGSQVSLTHSYVDPQRRGHGIGSALAQYALEDLRDHDLKPTIYCGFVADYVRDHAEWAETVEIPPSGLLASRTDRTLGPPE